jgi:hypothetical protein
MLAIPNDDYYLSILAVELVNVGYPFQALAAAKAIPSSSHVAEVQVELVPLLVEHGYLDEAIEAAQSASENYRYTDTLAELAPRLARLGHEEHALAAVRRLEELSQRAEALAAVAAHSVADHKHLTAEAFSILKAIGHRRKRAQAVVVLAPQLAELPRDVFYPRWCDTLTQLSSDPDLHFSQV